MGGHGFFNITCGCGLIHVNRADFDALKDACIERYF